MTEDDKARCYDERRCFWCKEQHLMCRAGKASLMLRK